MLFQVGYAVRGDHKTSSDTCITFCTTGVLLRRLQSDTELEGVTHVVVDEVHERTVESDLLLVPERACARSYYAAIMQRVSFAKYISCGQGHFLPAARAISAKASSYYSSS